MQPLPNWYMEYRFAAAVVDFDVLQDYERMETALTTHKTAESRKIYEGKLRMLLIVALAQDLERDLIPGGRASRILFCAEGGNRLLRFFDRMADSGMNPSTRQNYHHALRLISKAVQKVDSIVQATPDIARAAATLDDLLKGHVDRCENDRQRFMGENRAEASFVERKLEISLEKHELFWQFNLEALRRHQLAVAKHTNRWRLIYFLRFVVFLFYIPVRRSFWTKMHNAGVHLDPTGQHYLALPNVEKSIHLRRGFRPYYQLPLHHTDVMTWYIQHGRSLLAQGQHGDAASDTFLLSDTGRPIRPDTVTDVVRKFLYECTGLKMTLRTYRFLFAMAVKCSDDIEERHKLYLTQQLRHSLATQQK